MAVSLPTKLTIRKNDMVEIISGREKGKTGKVIQVDYKNHRIFVEKLNLIKRHTKPSQQNPQGGITEKEASVHYSNVLLVCPKCNGGKRHGIKVTQGKGKEKSTKKVRFCKKCDSVLDS